MNRSIALIPALITGLTLALALPTAASASCATDAGGSATISCTQGVMVVRQSPGRAPSIDPATAAQLRLQRQERFDRVAQQARANGIANAKLKLEQQRLNNQDYLYRDANSPLRQRTRPLGYGSRGYRSAGRGVIVLNAR